MKTTDERGLQKTIKERLRKTERSKGNRSHCERVRAKLIIPEMSALRKAMEWLIGFSIVNLMLGCLLFKKIKKLKEFSS